MIRSCLIRLFGTQIYILISKKNVFFEQPLKVALSINMLVVTLLILKLTNIMT